MLSLTSQMHQSRVLGEQKRKGLHEMASLALSPQTPYTATF